MGLNWPQSVLCVLALVVLNEAEAARGPFELVQAHDDPLDVADFAEELVELLLRRVERHVANVERRRLTQKSLLKKEEYIYWWRALRTNFKSPSRPQPANLIWKPSGTRSMQLSFRENFKHYGNILF